MVSHPVRLDPFSTTFISYFSPTLDINEDPLVQYKGRKRSPLITKSNTEAGQMSTKDQKSFENQEMTKVIIYVIHIVFVGSREK